MVGGRRRLELLRRVNQLLIDDNLGNLDAFVHWRTLELELQQQATNSIGQGHEIALVVRLHKNPSQRTRMNTHTPS